jgi:hypothetical protein
MSQTYGVIPFLREDASPKQLSTKGSPLASMKKLKVLHTNSSDGGNAWDNKSIGLPISTFNERVHSSFRIGFQDLNHKAYATVTSSSKKPSRYV